MPEGSQGRSDFDVVVWVVTSVHGDDCCWRAEVSVRKHPDEYQISVVDPVEFGVG